LLFSKALRRRAASMQPRVCAEPLPAALRLVPRGAAVASILGCVVTRGATHYEFAAVASIDRPGTLASLAGIAHLQNATWIESGNPHLELVGLGWSACRVAPDEMGTVLRCEFDAPPLDSLRLRLAMFGARGEFEMPLADAALRGDGRWLVWNPTPIYVKEGAALRKDRLGSWVREWRDAGFVDVHVLARDDTVCARASGLGLACAVRPPIDAAMSATGAARYHDLTLYNLLGLVTATALRHDVVAFMDLDELPPPDMDAKARGLLNSSRGYLRAFFRGERCRPPSFCPASECELAAAAASGVCDAELHHTGNSKLVAVPRRLRMISAHEAWTHSHDQKPPHIAAKGCAGRNWPFDLCLRNRSVFG